MSASIISHARFVVRADELRAAERHDTFIEFAKASAALTPLEDAMTQIEAACAEALEAAHQARAYVAAADAALSDLTSCRLDLHHSLLTARTRYAAAQQQLARYR